MSNIIAYPKLKSTLATISKVGKSALHKVVQINTVNIPHIESQQDLWNCLRDAWKGPFMATCKLGFIMNQFD
jgi:hypothetical protein